MLAEIMEIRQSTVDPLQEALRQSKESLEPLMNAALRKEANRIMKDAKRKPRKHGSR